MLQDYPDEEIQKFCDDIFTEEKCDNCKFCSRSSGSYMGTTDYWCRIQNGRKYASHVCGFYQEETK
jgi:hypothetical protein